MEFWADLESVPADWSRSVVTVGVFDGVHRGHQVLIRRAVETGRDLGLPVALLTFDPHPLAVLTPTRQPARLTTLARRVDLIAGLGVGALLALPFTRDVAAMTPEQFVRDIVVGRLHAGHVLVGRNFRFGHRGAGSVETLAELGRRHGFVVSCLELASDGRQRDEIICSTAIRAMVACGDVAGATRYLGRSHRIEGLITSGASVADRPGHYPAGIEIDRDSAIPADGHYVGRLITGRKCWAAVIVVEAVSDCPEVPPIVSVSVGGLLLPGHRVGLDFVVKQPSPLARPAHHPSGSTLFVDEVARIDQRGPEHL